MSEPGPEVDSPPPPHHGRTDGPAYANPRPRHAAVAASAHGSSRPGAGSRRAGNRGRQSAWRRGRGSRASADLTAPPWRAGLPRELARLCRWAAGGQGPGAGVGTAGPARRPAPAHKQGKAQGRRARREDERGGMARRPRPRQQGSSIRTRSRGLAGTGWDGEGRDSGQQAPDHLQVRRPAADAAGGAHQADQQQQGRHPARAQAPTRKGDHATRLNQRRCPARPDLGRAPPDGPTISGGPSAKGRQQKAVSEVVPPRDPSQAGFPGSGSCPLRSRCVSRRIRLRRAGPSTRRGRPWSKEQSSAGIRVASTMQDAHP